MKLTLLNTDSKSKKLSEAYQVDEANVDLQEAEDSSNEVDIPEIDPKDFEQDSEKSNLLQPDKDLDKDIESSEDDIETPQLDNTETNFNDSDNNLINNRDDDARNDAIINNFNNLASQLWNIIDMLKGSKDFIDADNLSVNNRDYIIKLMEDLIDDITIDIGVVYKLIELANPKISLLLNKGQNKASEKILDTTNIDVDNLSTL